MNEILDVYKCNVCGKIVEILSGGAGELVCCNEPMEFLEEQNEGISADTHKPVIVVEDKNVTIRVGQIPHEMTESHRILFIDAISLDKKYLKRKFLKADEVPDLSFICNSVDMKARAMCNLHGLWKNE